jgi:putative ABC transport system permease protein
VIDVKSKSAIYGIDPTLPTPDEPLELYLADKRLDLVGTFSLGTDFANDGTLFMSVENFADYFPFREMPADPLSTVDLGLVVCAEPSQREELRDRLQRRLGQRVDVRTREQFMANEIAFWDKNTPIGAIFQVGVIMGFVVGVLICYQVLFNDISDHLSEFATLMAMGYSSRYFVGVVVRASIYVALFGFLPGLGISWVLFQAISSVTGLTMALSLFEIGLTLSFTVVMCILSGLLAVRKLLSADPASLF